MTNYPLNPNTVTKIRRIGRESEQVLVIDDFSVAADKLVHTAQNARDWQSAAPGTYPGQRAGLPREYVKNVLQMLDGPIKRRLLRTNASLESFSCSYSMVCNTPATLSPLQQVPHIDVASPFRIAAMHYLCGEQFGGTAFYRQNSTALETVPTEKRDEYLTARARDLQTLGKPAQYPNQFTPGYTQTGTIGAKFNRLIVFRSFLLHSGIINDPSKLSQDPGTGRLTANFFLDYLPKN